MRKRAAEPVVDPPFPVPSVWREQGYLVLAFEPEGNEVHYFSTLDGHRSMPYERFQLRMKPQPELSPAQLALSFIVRAHEGLVKMRVRTERKLVSLLNVEELSKMSERRLAEVYRSVMGSGPQRIASDQRELRIKEMIEKSKEAASSTSDEHANGNGADQAEPTAKKRASKKTTPKAPREKKERAVKPKVVKEPKPPKAKKVKDPENPFREGTMKAKAFAYYKKTPDDTAKVIKQIEELGAKPSTARGWLGAFRKLAAS